MTSTSRSEPQAARFALAPPRHFLLPAVLLLVSEGPSHGYQLVKEVTSLHLGRADGPSVYRALAQLEAGGLVEGWSDAPVAGRMRRVYGVTEEGQRALRAWMGVIKEERDGLDRVLRRYAATGTIDAMLAEAEAGLVAVAGTAWSPVSPLSADGARPRLIEEPSVLDHPAAAAPPGPFEGCTRGRYRLVSDRSVVLIEVRSTVGPISFGAMGVDGVIDASTARGRVLVDDPPTARVEIPVCELRSGNGLYDAELLRRIDARRFPLVTLELDDCVPVGATGRYRLAGSATVHGVTRPAEGTVEVALTAPGRLVVVGEQVFDIRDFGIDSPTVLMLRIYPDVTVRLHVEAELESGPEPDVGRSDVDR